MSFSTFKALGLFTLVGVAGIVACSSDDATTPATTTTTATTAAVTGAADTHCTGVTPVTVEAAACTQPIAHHDDTDGGDAGADDLRTNGVYGPTRYNAASDDDDCKYHVAWKATAIAENTDVSFIATVTNKADGSAVKGATPRLELFLNDTHPGPNVAGTKAVESPDGTYTIGPVRFDAPGQWTVRFHFFETCNDNEHSPHGHAAFFATIP